MLLIGAETLNEMEAWDHLDRGVKLANERRLAEAIASFDRVLALTPDDMVAHWNRALSLLSLGRYSEALEELEWRWKLFNWRWGYLGHDVERVAAIEQWLGQDINGKHLLYYHEQGYGDNIMMARYLPMMRAKGCKITLLTVPPLIRLLSRFKPDNVITALPDDLSEFDYRCSAFLPMRVFQTTVDSIPPAPYLATKFAREPGTIGLVWSGVTQKKLSAAKFLHLLNPGAAYRLKSLQPGPVMQGVEPLVSEDFLDTMNQMARMEHIVTVDTAIANLAGAMGHPSAHVILPLLQDWRWYYADKWYPTLKIYRQQGDDWNAPFAQVREALRCQH
jgi:hypothetical protein